MPVPFAPFVGFLLGIAFAWAARADIGKDDGPALASRPFLVAVAFALFIQGPIVAYFVTFHGDWAYLYLLDWHRLPSAVDLSFVLLSALAVPAGALTALPAARGRRLGTVVRIGAGPLVLVCVLLVWGARRLAVSATYAQFHGDFGTESIGSSTLGHGILWMGILFVLGVAWSVRLASQRDDSLR